jgi:Uma2 family endonuclease
MNMVLTKEKTNLKTTTKIKDELKTYSLEEYRNLAEKTELKYEFNNGEISEMTGGTINHNTLILNLIFLLKLSLKNNNFNIYSSDLRLFIPTYNKATYPDLMVVDGEPMLSNNRQDEILNPCLIVEVLSPSTQNYDRSDKFLYYRSIPYLKEYLLISQSEYYLEYYQKKAENQWLLQEYKGEEIEVNLEYLKIVLSAKELYQKITF